MYLALPGLNPDSPNVFKEMDSVAVKLRAANPNKPVYKPELLSKVKELSDLQAKLDPAFFCKLPGVPRMGPPAQIVQSTGLVVLLYGDQNAFRVVPTDGRKHREDVEPSYLGDSIGWWEGDTLVVEANQFTEDTWLGSDGYFHSPAMRVIERFQRVGDALQYSATVHDPEVLAEPWNMPAAHAEALDRSCRCARRGAALHRERLPAHVDERASLKRRFSQHSRLARRGRWSGTRAKQMQSISRWRGRLISSNPPASAGI